MKQIFALERRIHDLERAIQNMERMGEIVDVKFDDEKKRWYVKMNDGEDLTPSGQKSESQGAADTFKSDWLPWKSFAHGSISMSVPPRKGMKASMRSPGGYPELAVAEPFSYGPENKSPHDKEDEIFMTVKLPGEEDKNQTLKVLATKDKLNFTLGDTVFDLSKSKLDVTINDAKLEITAGGVKVTVSGTEFNMTGDGFTQTGGTMKHNDANIGDSHIHGGIVIGPSDTGPPSN
jgi:phage baseplate assembly protein gpV